jgi:hypothetical protein
VTRVAAASLVPGDQVRVAGVTRTVYGVDTTRDPGTRAIRTVVEFTNGEPLVLRPDRTVDLVQPAGLTGK